MRKFLLFSLIVATVVFFSACSKNTTPVPDDPVDLEALYNAAIRDAITADSAEICDTLLPISSSNSKLEWRRINNEQYVLLGNFNRFPGSYSDSSVINYWGVIWVFIPAQYKYRMRSASIPNKDTLLRIRQLIGLPPGNTNTYMVELWVKPRDLFRPASNPAVDSKTCGLYFPAGSDSSYVKWFNQNIYDAYFGMQTHLPWTRLGYSYDWAKNVPEVGLSEYCIRPNAQLYVKKLVPATRYLDN